MTAPYVSFILAGRNDGYGGDLEARVNSCLRHLHYRLGSGEGLYEIVVCDWNPPSPEQAMITGFDWSDFASVRFIQVNPALHAAYAGTSNFPILDYVARNVAIRRARGRFVCVFNQDIYLSEPIAAAIRERSLSDAYFYRADRCDFRADFTLGPAAFDDVIHDHVFIVNRRHFDLFRPVSPQVAPGTPIAAWPASEPAAHETVSANGLYAYARQEDRVNYPSISDLNFVEIIGRLSLHTNAAGDFVLCPREFFEYVHGFVETSQFYMHLDSYIMFQFYAAGFNQALFLSPALIFHADHDRSGRAGRHEGISYADHEQRWRRLLNGDLDFRFNNADWGLAEHPLPEVGLCFGQRN